MNVIENAYDVNNYSFDKVDSCVLPIWAIS